MLVQLMMIEKTPFSGVKESTGIKRIYLNPRHIVSVTEELRTDLTLTESVIQEIGADRSLSRITVSEGNSTKSITVVGSPSQIYK